MIVPRGNHERDMWFREEWTMRMVTRMTATAGMVGMLFAAMIVVAAAAGGQTPAPDAAAAKAANPELVGMLTKEVGVTPAQAEGGAGALLGLAKSRLSAEEFGKVSSAIPGTDAMLKAAPALGMSSALGNLPGGSAGLASVGGAFSKLGLTPDAAAKFAPVMLKYVNGKGATEAAGLLGRVFK